MTRRRRLIVQTMHAAGSCPMCNGTGRTTLHVSHVVRGIPCPDCGGTGSSR